MVELGSRPPVGEVVAGAAGAEMARAEIAGAEAVGAGTEVAGAYLYLVTIQCNDHAAYSSHGSCI